MLRHLVNVLLFFLPASRFLALRRGVLRIAGCELADNVSFCGSGWIYGRGRLLISADSWLSPGIKFYTHPDALITIGRNCDIGPDVEFVLGSHRIGPSQRRAGEGMALPIEIGDGCWIGARTIILGGVRMGPGCVVGAGSVVTRNVPANVLVAGVPARVVRELVE